MALVGRQRELTTLADTLTAAADGRGAVVLAVGEPGIGKTRLLEEATTEAARRGFVTAWGRAWEVSTAPPYWPWIEVIRELASHGSDPGPLALLLPELGRGARSALEADPFRLYDAVVAFLHVASARHPIAIVLDDLHAADPSTVRLAELVAPHLRHMRAVLVGSYRDLEARRSPAIEAALARLGRRADTLPLARLDSASVDELVRERLGRDDRQASRMIHDASDGNPLFVTELLKLVASRGAGARDVPAGVRAVIRERLALLSPATVALLQAAAIVGRTFGIAVPAELAGVTSAALEEAVAEAASAEIVEPVDHGRYRFSHALVAETLVADLAAGVRSKLHRRAAEALERHHAADPRAPLAEIAHHWREAGLEHAARAVDAAITAARAAQERVAYDDADALYDSALASLALAAPNDLQRRAELLVARSEVLVRGGDRARALAPCTEATELAQSLGDGVLFARAALAFGADAFVATVDASLVRLLERALDALPPHDDPWRAKIMARLAAARQPAEDPDRPLALARDAIEMARRLGDPAVLRDVLFAALGALVDFAPPAERARCNTELLPLLDGDTPRTLRTLQRLAFDLIELGDMPGFDTTIARYEALGIATGQPRYQWAPLLFRSMRARWEGHLDDERRFSAEAMTIRERLGDEVVPFLRLIRPYVHYGFADAGDQLESIVHAMTAPEVWTEHAFRGWAYITAGRLDVARRECDWLRDNVDARQPGYHTLEAFSTIAWTFGDRDLAAHHLAVGARYAGRAQLVSSVAFIFIGVVDHGLMRSALVLEQWAEAERYQRSAVQLCDRLGARTLRAQIERDWAAARGRATAIPAPVPRFGVVLTLEGEYWTVEGSGELCRIKDTRGMQMLARLVAEPKRALHVLDLAGADVVDAGDAGTVIDRAARDQYMLRVRELQAELAEASAWNDRGRQERVERELDAIAEQLSSAYGIGGREKRVGSATERARTNVRRRIADALQRIAEAAPALGRHFAQTVKTGVMCVYDPDR